MRRDAKATRERIAKAAATEFAMYGIAGARVDRIAEEASANKGMIYVYFGSKEQLFEAVLKEAVEELLTAVRLDATYLPEYAGKLYDHYRKSPHLMRLARWRALEVPNTRADAPVEVPVAERATAEKIEAIQAAQESGLVDDAFPAGQLLTVLLAVAGAWSSGAPESAGAKESSEEISARRAAIVEAVRRIVSPNQDLLS